MFRAYERFALYPALEAEIPLEGPLEGYTEYVFSDLRFGSTIGWVDDIQVAARQAHDLRIMARVAPDGRVSTSPLHYHHRRGRRQRLESACGVKKERGKSGEGRGKPPGEGFSSPCLSFPKLYKWGAGVKGVPPFSNQQLPASEWLHVSVVSLLNRLTP